MTKVLLGSYVWVYIHIVLDWYTKEIVGLMLAEKVELRVDLMRWKGS